MTEIFNEADARRAVTRENIDLPPSVRFSERFYPRAPHPHTPRLLFHRGAGAYNRYMYND